MKGLSVKALAAIAVAVSFGTVSAQNMPYPQQKNYANCIKPTGAQAALDKAVKDYYYNFYKGKFLKQSTTVTGGYYYDSKGAGAGGNTGLTVSEQHGYGMMITALMAGPNGDPDAKKIFDGMYKFWKKFPSPESNGYLMDWLISTGEVATGKSSATDGDLDIAYAMLLANAQWGGSPEGSTETYAQIAKNILNDIKMSNITNTYRMNLGDWGTSQLDTRPSDWMPDHFRSFALVQDGSIWGQVSDTVYSMINQVTNGYASTTGFMPDFVTGSPAVPDLSGGGTTGEATNNQYGWNACRYPWRITTDYAMWGTAAAKSAMVKVTDYISGLYADPADIPSGAYPLAGISSPKNYTSDAFTAPFVAGAIVDSKYQTFLDKGWTYLLSNTNEQASQTDAYNTAVKLMSMMVISGNWWKPTDSPNGNVTGPDTTKQFMFDDFAAAPNGQTDLGVRIGAKKYGTTIDKDSCGLWYVWQDQDAKTGKGTTFTNLTGTALESVQNGPNNAGDMMNGGVMGFKISKGTLDNDWAGIGVSFGQSKGDPNLALDYYDLSKMTAIMLRIKGTGTLRFSIATKDVDAAGGGYYGTEISGLTDQWQTIVIDPSTFTPEANSAAAEGLLKWADGNTQCHTIGLDAASQICNIEIDYIKLCGVSEATFGLDPINGNVAPTAVSLSNSSIKNNATVGTVVGTLAATDANMGDTHTFTLVSGTGFEIVGNQLKTTTTLAIGSYPISVTATDQGGASYTQSLTVTVTDAAANNTPTNITLSNSSITTDVAVGTVVGMLTATDADAGETFTYSIVGTSSEFAVSGNQLITKADLTAGDYVVTIRVADKAGATFDKAFTISAADPVEPATLIETLGWWAYATATTDVANSTLKGGAAELPYDSLVIFSDTGSVVRCDFTMGTIFNNGTSTNYDDDVYPDAALSSDTLRVNNVPFNLGKSATITITYKSDAAFDLKLPNANVTDYNEFKATLPSTNGAVSSKTLSVNSATFKQEDWGTPAATFDATKMYELVFAPTATGKTSYIEISDIKIDGLVGIADEVKKSVAPANLMMNLTNSQMNIAAPKAGTYTVSLYSVDGRLLKQVSAQLNAGQNSLAWNGSEFGSKMIISRIQGAGLSVTQKYLIK